MFHLDNNSGVSAMPPLGAVQSSAPRWFTEGGGGVPASYPGAGWFNMVQAELLNLCSAYGIAPDKANLNQLKLAIDAAVNQRAPLASPAFTGVPTAPTAGQSTNNTQIATTAFVKAALAALVDSSPAALDTLNELAAALGNDPNFATTMTNALANKQAKDATLTALSGKDVAGLLTYLGLGGVASLRQATFTASGSWTCPAGVTQISIDACGGGGGGAGGASGGTGGGGGGGAAAVIGRKITVVPGTVYTVTIGIGGAGGTTNSAPGGTGGTTSLGALLSLSGGVGGTRVTTGGGGAAGGEGGLPGYDGYYSSNPSVSVAGAGGGCLLGAGGAGGATSQIGCKPGQFGGGGGGGAGQAVTGGDGAGGFMRITW